MAVEIRCRYRTGTYVATVRGQKQTASNTIGAREAAVAMARKLGLDPSLLVEGQRDLLNPNELATFSHPGHQVERPHDR